MNTNQSEAQTASVSLGRNILNVRELKSSASYTEKLDQETRNEIGKQNNPCLEVVVVDILPENRVRCRVQSRGIYERYIHVPGEYLSPCKTVIASKK